MIEDAKRKAYYGIVDQDDEKMAEGFSWDKFIPADSNVQAFIAPYYSKARNAEGMDGSVI